MLSPPPPRSQAVMVRKQLAVTTAMVLTMCCHRHVAKCAVLHQHWVGKPRGTVLSAAVALLLLGVPGSGHNHGTELPSTTGTHRAACGGLCIAGTCRRGWLLQNGWLASRTWIRHSST